MVTDLVEVVNSRAVTTSLRVAEYFEKDHFVVLRSIKDIIKDSAGELTDCNFVVSEYVDSTGRKLPMYLMDRDGFTLLAMGFTGKKALKFKLDYIAAFNAMEKVLRDAHRPVQRPLEDVATIYKYAGLKDNQLALALDKFYKAETGVSALDRGAVILEAPVKRQLLTPTEIARELGTNYSARKVNRLLAAMGLQRKRGNGKWEPIHAKDAVMLDTGKRYSDGTPVVQLKWHSDVVKQIKDWLA